MDSADSGSINWPSVADGGFEMEFEDPPPRSWSSSIDGGFEMEFEDPPPRSWSSSTSQSSAGLDVVCSEVGFQITLPPGPLNEVKAVGMYVDFSAPCFFF